MRPKCIWPICAGIAVMLVSSSARATTVYSGVRNFAVPNTGIGLFINVIDGTTYSGPLLFPEVIGPGGNWDINLFGSAAWGLFPPNNAGQSPPTPVPVSQKGYVATSSTGLASNLAPGTIIGPSSIFNTQGPDADLLATGQPAIFGFRFRNEMSAPFTTHYAWARVILVNAQPGTLVDYAWESQPNTPIAAGAIPEPAASALVLTVIGFGYRRDRARRLPL